MQQHPDLLAVDESGRRVQFGNRCHYCVNSPEFHAATRRIVSAIAERFGSNPHVIGWQLDNEYNRVCYCDRCRRLFQRYLAEKFGSLKALNQHWTTRYWSQTYSAWEQIPIPIGPHNPGLMLEWKHFVTESYRQFQRLQLDALRPHLRPGVWVTHNFMGWFDGFDHYALTEDLDLASWEGRIVPMTEFSQKQDHIQALLAERELDALLLRRVSSFAWATCGAASYVNTATTNGEATLLITPSGRYLITNNIEAARLEQEENLAAQDWEFRVASWHEVQDTVAELTRGLGLGADGPYPGAADLSGDLARLRANLTPEEGERFRALGRLCAEAMDSAVRAVRPGQTEHQIAALLAHEAENRGVQAIVNLIAADGRIFAFRHPLPTDKELERYAMLVLCGRRRGLVCSLTRFVHLGRLPDDLRRKAEAVAQIDATFIAATRPGQTLGEIFRCATEVYAETGFPDEWHLHHQGGPAGYEPREYVATPHSTDVVSVGQAYAWNPSITGTKSEDTILVGEAGNEVLTAIENWPTLPVTVDGQEIARPAILEIP